MNVDQLAFMIKTKVNEIRNVNVQGEIGKITVASSGHVYFDLMSEKSRVSCVCWSSSNIKAVKGGASVSIQSVDYYPPFGKCHAIVNKIECMDNNTDIADKHAHLISALTKDGTIHRMRLTIPEIINHLCIITSDGSAAYHDMIEGINSRWPGLKTTIIHSSVQGQQAISSLELAFKKAHEIKPDVIICGRGGGSECDLEVFNDEKVVRCFVSSTIPIVSAVGHENDHCICDLVSDMRAKTPTASIETCISTTYADRKAKLKTIQADCVFFVEKKLIDLRQNYNKTTENLHIVVRNAFNSYINRLQNIGKTATSIVQNKIQKTEDRLSNLYIRLEHIYKQKLSEFEHQIKMLKSKLNAHSIAQNLQNGYCVLLDSNDTIVKNTDSISENDNMCVVLDDGKIDVYVKNVRKRKR